MSPWIAFAPVLYASVTTIASAQPVDPPAEPPAAPAEPASPPPETAPPPVVSSAPPPHAAPPESPWVRVERDTAADRDLDREEPSDPEERPIGKRVLHGFRLGYVYLMRGGSPDPGHPDQTVLERLELRSPSSFLVGYELIYRLVGHSWLNVLLVGNVMLAGLEQSRALPSVNLLIGFEIDEEIQAGVGVDLTPDREKVSHMIAAVGWTPRVGSFWVPVHFFLVPDVDGNHRMGGTVGVTW